MSKIEEVKKLRKKAWKASRKLSACWGAADLVLETSYGTKYVAITINGRSLCPYTYDWVHVDGKSPDNDIGRQQFLVENFDEAMAHLEHLAEKALQNPMSSEEKRRKGDSLVEQNCPRLFRFFLR